MTHTTTSKLNTSDNPAYRIDNRYLQNISILASQFGDVKSVRPDPNPRYCVGFAN